MRTSQIFLIAISNIKSNRMRSLLTIMGIAVGIATIVFLVSLGYGLQELSTKKIANIAAINTLDVSPGKTAVQKVDNALVAKIKEIPEVESISPLLSLGLKVDYQGKKTDAVGSFVDDEFSRLEGVETVIGGFFSNSPENIVVSTALLRALDITSTDAVKKEFDILVIFIDSATKEKKEIAKKYSVIGVAQDESVSFAYVPISSISDLVTDNTVYNSLKVNIKDQKTIPHVKEEITSMGFTVTSIADTISQVDQIFRIIQLILAFFGLVALLVASIGMFNTMTIALLERTRDIGIMKSLGVRDRDVSKIFLTESSMISTLGGGAGVVLGYLTAIGVNIGVNSLAKSVGGQPEKLFTTPFFFAAGIVVFSIFVGFLTGFYPSRRASKLNPLDALRYE
jgi:putative ABC transport system permease protein